MSYPHVFFLFSHVSSLGLTTWHFLFYLRVSSRFVHMSVSYWTMRPFLVLPHVCFRPPHVRNLNVPCVHILHVDVYIDPFHHRTTNYMVLLFIESTPQSIKLQPNKFMRQPNKCMRQQASLLRHTRSGQQGCSCGRFY